MEIKNGHQKNTQRRGKAQCISFAVGLLTAVALLLNTLLGNGLSSFAEGGVLSFAHQNEAADFWDEEGPVWNDFETEALYDATRSDAEKLIGFKRMEIPTNSNAQVRTALRYMVNFETNGGEEIPPVSVNPGDSLDLSHYIPEKTNGAGLQNIFLGWYTDPNFAPGNRKEGEFTPDSDVTLYAKWDLHPDLIANTFPVSGDILVQKEGMNSFDTEHESFYKVRKTDVLNYKATVNAMETTQYLEMLKEMFLADRPWLSGEREGDKIVLKNMSSRFLVHINPDWRVCFPEEISAYTMSEGCFSITNVTKTQYDEINITMELDTTGISTFADLYDVLKDYLNLITLTVHGVTIAQEAEVGDILTTYGEVSGVFSAVAVSPQTEADGNPHPEQAFDFKWEGHQDKHIPGTGEDGTDFIYKYRTRSITTPEHPISLSLEVVKGEAVPPVHPPVHMEENIEGDILVRRHGEGDFDTEHNEVFHAEKNTLLDYKATIDSGAAKGQFDKLKKQLLTNHPWLTKEKEGDKISLKDMSGRFVAVITPDSKLSFPADVGSYDFQGDPFMLTSITRNEDGTLTAVMDLKTEGLNNFADLCDAIYPALDCISLTANGVRILNKANAGDDMTVKYALSGMFQATAMSPVGAEDGAPDEMQEFSFAWTAEQDHNIPVFGTDGLDHILEGSSDTKTIQLTVEVQQNEEPPAIKQEGSLVVTNTVRGSGSDKNKTFAFQVTLNEQTINGIYGEMSFHDGIATFTLKDGEQKRADMLPAGIAYKVSEDDNEGYTVTKKNDTGIIEDKKMAIAAFENIKENSGGNGGYNGGGNHSGGFVKNPKGGVRILKQVTGKNAPTEGIDYHFYIRMKDESGNSVSGEASYAYVRSDGSVERGNLHVDREGYFFTLKNGETATFNRIESNRNVEIGEVSDGTFTTVSEGLEDGVLKILSGKTKTVRFVNDYGDATPLDDTTFTPEKLPKTGDGVNKQLQVLFSLFFAVLCLGAAFVQKIRK